MDINILEFKRLFKSLNLSKGLNNSGLITMIYPSSVKLWQINDKLKFELSTASNIKDKNNRKSVIDSLKSIINQLKKYNDKDIINGIIILSGEIIFDNKEKQICYIFTQEIPKPINISLYKCDNKFHIDQLIYLFDDNQKNIFVVIDGHGILIGKLAGTDKSILFKKEIVLSNQHKTGGQSAVRFERLRDAQIKNFITISIDNIKSKIIDENGLFKFDNIIIGGASILKDDLYNQLDDKLKSFVLARITLNKSLEEGFDELINLSKDYLKNNNISKEEEILKMFFDTLKFNDDLCFYGFTDFEKYNNEFLIDILIINEDNLERINLDVIKCKYNIVSDRTFLGISFKKDFQGIGGILKFNPFIYNID